MSDDQLDIAGQSLSRSHLFFLFLFLLSPSFLLSLVLSPLDPLASRRGDRIISEAFARFLPLPPSPILFLPVERGVLNNCNWTRSQQLHLQRSSSPLAHSLPISTLVRISSHVLSLPPAFFSPFLSHYLSERAAHFTIHFVHLPFKE